MLGTRGTLFSRIWVAGSIHDLSRNDTVQCTSTAIFKVFTYCLSSISKPTNFPYVAYFHLNQILSLHRTPKKMPPQHWLDSTQPPQLPINLLEWLVLVLTKDPTRTPNRSSSDSTLFISMLRSSQLRSRFPTSFSTPLSLHSLQPKNRLKINEEGVGRVGIVGLQHGSKWEWGEM